MTFTNRLRSLFFNLRCRAVKNIKDTFHKYFKNNLSSTFLCENTIDSQEHLLICPGIKKHLSITQLEVLNKVRYGKLFGNHMYQFDVAKVFQMVLKVQDRLLDETRRPVYHLNSSGPTG